MDTANILCRNYNPQDHNEQNYAKIRYLSLQDLERFLAVIDNQEHKLIMRLIYELGCRVGEFVRIRLNHFDFHNNSVFFPAENTQTERTSYISPSLMNDIKSYLKCQGRITEKDCLVDEPNSYLFRSNTKRRPKDKGMTENCVRNIFLKYIDKAGLQQIYGHDKRGKNLHLYTVHSLRHSHIMHARHIHGIRDSIIAKQVGYTSLQAISVYDKPTKEIVKAAYAAARAEEGSPQGIKQLTKGISI